MKTVPLKWEDPPKYGHLLTIWDWVRSCTVGAFIDYDGYGNLATADKISNIIIRPSDLKEYNQLCDYGGNIVEIPEDVVFTHVMWYNR